MNYDDRPVTIWLGADDACAAHWIYEAYAPEDRLNQMVEWLRYRWRCSDWSPWKDGFARFAGNLPPREGKVRSVTFSGVHAANIRRVQKNLGGRYSLQEIVRFDLWHHINVSAQEPETRGAIDFLLEAYRNGEVSVDKDGVHLNRVPVNGRWFVKTEE